MQEIPKLPVLNRAARRMLLDVASMAKKYGVKWTAHTRPAGDAWFTANCSLQRYADPVKLEFVVLQYNITEANITEDYGEIAYLDGVPICFQGHDEADEDIDYVQDIDPSNGVYFMPVRKIVDLIAKRKMEMFT